MSPERKQAHFKMREALQLAKGRRPQRAVEAMSEAISLDPTYLEPRQWLANHYRQDGKLRLAVEQYEEMLRLQPDNEQLWAALKELDPATEQRLRRLHDVASDPFFAQRAAADTSEFDDLGQEENQQFIEAEPEGAPFLGGRGALDADLLADDDAAAEAYLEPLPWEHEQDREYRDRLDASDAFYQVLYGFAMLWDDEGAWEYALADCDEPDTVGWPELTQLTQRAAEALEAESPRVLAYAEPLRVPLAAPLAMGTVIIGGDSRDRFCEPELLFWLGSACHDLVGGAAEYRWACEEILQRQAPRVHLHSWVSDAVKEHIAGWDRDLSDQELTGLKRLAHAWEQRAVLSADRGGLLATGNVAAACRAIAAAATDPQQDATITVQQFLNRFARIEVAKLAAIGTDRDPWLDAQYAAYRIRMLHWWSTTEDYKELAGA